MFYQLSRTFGHRLAHDYRATSRCPFCLRARARARPFAHVTNSFFQKPKRRGRQPDPRMGTTQPPRRPLTLRPVWLQGQAVLSVIGRRKAPPFRRGRASVTDPRECPPRGEQKSRLRRPATGSPTGEVGGGTDLVRGVCSQGWQFDLSLGVPWNASRRAVDGTIDLNARSRRARRRAPACRARQGPSEVVDATPGPSD